MTSGIIDSDATLGAASTPHVNPLTHTLLKGPVARDVSRIMTTVHGPFRPSYLGKNSSL